MWLSTSAFLVAFGFLIASLDRRRADFGIPYVLLSLFALLAALFFLPLTPAAGPLRFLGGFAVACASVFLAADFFLRLGRGFERTLAFLPWNRVRLSAEGAEIGRAVSELASRRMGALIVLERRPGTLVPYLRNAEWLDSEIKAEVLISFFHPKSPLHDGAVIVSRGRIKAVRGILPLSVRPDIPAAIGTRHRSAIGITERADVVALVVSEERGTMSVAYRGVLVTADSVEVFTELFHRAMKGKSIHERRSANSKNSAESRHFLERGNPGSRDAARHGSLSDPLRPFFGSHRPADRVSGLPS